MRLKLLCCEIFFREACHLLALTKNRVDVEFLPKALHDMESQDMRRELQAKIDLVPEGTYDAILMGYALCNNGLAGIRANATPLVVPKAHDCMTLFLGGRERYSKYFVDNPGTYFLTSGWLERSGNDGNEFAIQNKLGMSMKYEELVAQYGEDNAQFLQETLLDFTHNYHRFAFIAMGVGPVERFEALAQEKAVEKGFELAKVPGDLSLLSRLVDGPWDASEFLTVPPGRAVKAKYEDDVLTLD